MFVVEHGGASLELSLFVAWVACFGGATLRVLLDAVLSATRPRRGTGYTPSATGSRDGGDGGGGGGGGDGDSVERGRRISIRENVQLTLQEALRPWPMLKRITGLLPFFLCTSCLWFEKALSVYVNFAILATVS